MATFTLILLVLGLVLVVLCAFNLPTPPRCPHLGWLGLSCWGLAYLLHRTTF